MIVELLISFAIICAAALFLPLDRVHRLAIFVSGTSGLALYVAGRSPRDTNRMFGLVTTLVVAFIVYAVVHARRAPGAHRLQWAEQPSSRRTHTE